MSVGIIGGADGPTSTFLSGYSPIVKIGSIAAAIVLILLAALVFNKCLKSSEKPRKIFIFSALALNDVYMLAKAAKILLTLNNMFWSLYNGTSQPQGDEIDVFTRIYTANIYIGGLFAIVHNMLIADMIVFAFYKRMDKGFETAAAVVFYFVAATALAADVINALVNFGTPEMSVTAVLAALMIMIMAMFARMRKER